MVATRKSLPNADDELNPDDPKLKSILKKLKIDGTNVLKGDRQSKKKTAEVVAPKHVYHYRGAVYEVTGSELPEWIQAQPARYMSKSNSNSIEPEHAKDSTPSARGKKRKRETVESEEGLVGVPFAHSGAASPTGNSDGMTPAAVSGSSVPPPAQRRRLDHHVASDAVVGEASPRHVNRTAPVHNSSVRASLPRDTSRSSPTRSSQPHHTNSRQAASMANSIKRKRSARSHSPRPMRASHTPATTTAVAPPVRRQSAMPRSKRMSRSQVNREPTRDDAVDAGFQLDPLPVAAVLQAVSKELMKSICEMAKLNSEMDRKVREFKMVHLMLMNFKAGRPIPEFQGPAGVNPSDGHTEKSEGAEDPGSTSSDPVHKHVNSSEGRTSAVPGASLNGRIGVTSALAGDTPAPTRGGMLPTGPSMDRTTLTEHVNALPTTNSSGNPLRWSFDPSRLADEGRAESTIFRGRLPEESKSAKRRRIARELDQVRSWDRVQVDLI